MGRFLQPLKFVVRKELLMKQLGNLAIVCAQRKDTLLQMLNGNVCVHLGSGHDRTVLSAEWDDDAKITAMIHELNFGKYKEAIA